MSKHKPPTIVSVVYLKKLGDNVFYGVTLSDGRHYEASLWTRDAGVMSLGRVYSPGKPGGRRYRLSRHRAPLIWEPIRAALWAHRWGCVV